MTTLKDAQIDRIAREMLERGESVRRVPGGGGGGGAAGSSSGSAPRRETSFSSDPPIPYDQQLARALLDGTLQPEYETVLDFNFGWNTRAHFQDQILPGTRIRFRIPAYSAGVIVGLTRAPRDVDYDDIEFGIYQSRIPGVTLSDAANTSAVARVRLIRNGAIYTPEPPEITEAEETVITDMAAGEYYAADLFPLPLDGDAGIHELRVFADRVEYWITLYDGSPPEKIYTAPIPFSMWRLTAALYSGGDKVWDYDIAQADGDVDITLPLIGVFASDEADFTSANITIPSIEASGEDFIEGVDAEITLPRIFVLGGDDITNADIRIPALTMESYNESDGIPVIDITIGFARMPKIQVLAYAVDSTSADVDLDLPKVAVFATDQADLTIARIVLPGPVDAWANDIDDLGRVNMVEFAYTIGFTDGFEAFYIVWSEALGVVGLVNAAAIERALMASTANGSTSTITAAEIIQAMLASVMSAGDIASLAGDELQVWALHMDAMGSTRYEGYNFNSFATIDGVTYGASEAGIFRLDGNDDNGTDIQTLVDFGSRSFGTSERKSLPYVYVGMAANGKTYLRVTTTEIDRNNRPVNNTYTYQVRDNTEIMKTHRFEPGKGIRSTFLGLSLVSEGAAFDLHNIEFMPLKTTRRL